MMTHEALAARNVRHSRTRRDWKIGLLLFRLGDVQHSCRAQSLEVLQWPDDVLSFVAVTAESQ